MIVTILKKHGDQYMEICGCPLFNAIKESHPEIQLDSVGGTYITLEDGTHRKIINPFASRDIREVQSGHKDGLPVEIDMETVYLKSSDLL
jgi:hypothetical protein